jgi:hypothetical protein
MIEPEKFEDFVKARIQELDPLPHIPREEMWGRIEAARRFCRPRGPAVPGWTRWGLGLAAMLAVGIGIGRLSVTSKTLPSDDQTAERLQDPEGSASGTPLAYRVAALQELGRAEVLLTSVSTGTVDPQVARWARDLLISTQLLLDSPAAREPQLAQLLEDVELLLVQIASSAKTIDKTELNLIQRGIEQTDVLPRLRATLPAGSTPAGT